MTVNRIERVCCLCKYALPVAAILYLAVNGIPCDAVGVRDGHLIPARSHPCVERRDDAIFDGTHDFIRVRHVVDCKRLAWRSSAIRSSLGSSFPRSFARHRIPRHAFALK